MLLLTLGLVLVTTTTNGEYIFGKPSNGKLVHDMRTFLNVTFDWSSRLYWTQPAVKIPECHEWRIRRTYFERHAPEYTKYQQEYGVKQGTLVYPLSITVSDTFYFAAAVHRIKPKDVNDKTIQLILVRGSTWRLIWDAWIEAEWNGTDYCNGSDTPFGDLLPSINSNALNRPQYDDIVPQHYTDLTSDVCNQHECGCPKKQNETVTFAYPTKEGLNLLNASPFFENTDLFSLSNEQRYISEQARTLSEIQISDFIRVCNDRRIFARMGKTYKEDSLIGEKIRENQKVFYPTYM